MSLHKYCGIFTIVAAVLAVASPAGAQSPIPLMPESREINMALSAAPRELRAGAGVYVFGKGGFVRVRASRNGFNCLVERDIGVTAPVCYDAEGSRTLLRASLETGALLSRGIDSGSVSKSIDAAYKAGRLHAPRQAGIAYMLSSEFVRATASGKRQQIFPPHVMIYAPYLRNADIGVPPSLVGSRSHVWIEAEGRPDACIVVPVPDRRHNPSANSSVKR